MKEQEKGITGSTLKMVAMLTMLVDHIAATIIYRSIRHEMMISGAVTLEQQYEYINGHIGIYAVYMIMRIIGRMAFPIFCFLLVEGFLYTKSKKKYAYRLGMFALVSEIPFDLATNGALCSFEGQNVFFTLLLGLLAMMCLEKIEKSQSKKSKRILFSILVFVLFMALAFLLKTDYAAGGILTIIVMYCFRQDKMKRMAFGVLSLLSCGLIEGFAFVNLIFIRKYNGKRGSSLKYVFYCFYPVHLLVLSLICMGLHI